MTQFLYLLCFITFSITILQDFAHYKSGVYKHLAGEEMGGHAVKLIGWGTSDDGEDYWVIDMLQFLLSSFQAKIL